MEKFSEILYHYLPLCITGLKHSGKTTLGRYLSKKYHLDLIDTDEEIERIYGEKYSTMKKVREIYQEKGKAFFQSIEHAAVEHICTHVLPKKKRTIISTGGGLADNQPALLLLRDSCFMLYLQNSPNTLFQRIKRKGIPPFLNKKDPFGSFMNLYSRRSHVYENYADFILPTKNEQICTIESTLMEHMHKNQKDDTYGRKHIR